MLRELRVSAVKRNAVRRGALLALMAAPAMLRAEDAPASPPGAGAESRPYDAPPAPADLRIETPEGDAAIGTFTIAVVAEGSDRVVLAPASADDRPDSVPALAVRYRAAFSPAAAGAYAAWEQRVEVRYREASPFGRAQRVEVRALGPSNPGVTERFEYRGADRFGVWSFRFYLLPSDAETASDLVVAASEEWEVRVEPAPRPKLTAAARLALVQSTRRRAAYPDLRRTYYELEYELALEWALAPGAPRARLRVEVQARGRRAFAPAGLPDYVRVFAGRGATPHLWDQGDRYRPLLVVWDGRAAAPGLAWEGDRAQYRFRRRLRVTGDAFPVEDLWDYRISLGDALAAQPEHLWFVSTEWRCARAADFGEAAPTVHVPQAFAGALGAPRFAEETR